MAFAISHSGDPGEWADNFFRERVIAQIESARQEAVLHDGMRTSDEMEKFIYGSSNTRDEYMTLVASLVVALRDTKRKAHDEQNESHNNDGENSGQANGTATDEEQKS